MVLWTVLSAVAAVLVVLAVFAYNHLVRLRNDAETGWANIDVQLRRRTDLVPNLVDAVKGYAEHERDTPSRAAGRCAHFIESPLNQSSGLGSLFRGAFETHPPLADRIAALEEAGGFKLPPA